MVFFQTSGAGSTFQFVFLTAIGVGLGLVAVWKGWQQARSDPREFDSFPLIAAIAFTVGAWIGFPLLGWTMATGRFHEAEVMPDGAVVLRYAMVGEVRIEPNELADVRPELGHKHGVGAVFVARDDTRYYSRPIRTQRFDSDRAEILRLVGERSAAAKP